MPDTHRNWVFKLCLILLAFLLVQIPVQCQSGDVFVEVGQTATFSWTLPDLSHMAIFVVYNASDEKKLLALYSRNNTVYNRTFDDRFVYLGDTRQRNMTFTLSDVREWDAGWYRCGKNGVAIKISDCDQRLVVLDPLRAPQLWTVTPAVTSPVAMVTWSQETEVGVSVYFLLEFREDGGQWKTTSRNVTEAASPGSDVYSVLLEKLDPGKTYDVRLKAYNAYGRSPYSNESRFTVGQGTQCPARGDVSSGPLGAEPSLAVGLMLCLALAALLY